MVANVEGLVVKKTAKLFKIPCKCPKHATHISSSDFDLISYYCSVCDGIFDVDNSCEVFVDVKKDYSGSMLDPFGNWFEFSTNCSCFVGFGYNCDGMMISEAFCSQCEEPVSVNYSNKSYSHKSLQNVDKDTTKVCTCSSRTLFDEGCQCGSMVKETT